MCQVRELNVGPSDAEIGRLTAHHFGSSRFLQGYVKGKISADPAYSAVSEAVSRCPGSIADIGCGLGLLAHYLRARGVTNPMIGIEPDAAKVDQARAAAGRAGLTDVTWQVGGAEDQLPDADYYVLLDILHYMHSETQAALLGELARRVQSGGTVLIRNGIRDQSWRYRLTYLEELWVRSSRWIPVRAPICFPTVESITAPFQEIGASGTHRPLWRRTPFNSYWFEFRADPTSVSQPPIQAQT